jgi:translin
MDHSTLDPIADAIRHDFEEIDKARDSAFQQSRQLVATCARAIRAVHREEWNRAEELIAQAKAAGETLTNGVRAYPALYYAGYTQLRTP